MTIVTFAIVVSSFVRSSLETSHLNFLSAFLKAINGKLKIYWRFEANYNKEYLDEIEVIPYSISEALQEKDDTSDKVELPYQVI